MSRKHVKFLSIICIVALLFTVLTGCQPKQETAANAPAQPTQAAEKKDAAPKPANMRFSWWGGDARHKATLAAIEAYTKKNPHVKIEAEYGGFDSYYQKLVTQLAGGTAADIIQIDYKWVPDLAKQGKLFIDMNTLKDKIDMSGFDMNFAKSYGAAGDYLLGLPTGLNAMGLLANKEMFEKNGIAFKVEWTWDELLEAGAKLNKANPKFNLFAAQPQQLTYLVKIYLKQKTGNNFIKDDYTFGFDKAQLTEAFAYLVKAFDSGALAPLEETVLYDGKGWETIPGWLNGEYAFATAWASTVTTVKKASKFEMDVARYPIMPNPKDPGLLTTPSQILSVNSKSANVDEAVKFVNWFFNDEEAVKILSDTRGVPPTTKARKILADANMLDPNVTKAVDIALPFSGGPENGPTLNAEVETFLKDYIQKVGYKQLTPEKGAEELMKELESLLKTQKK